MMDREKDLVEILARLEEQRPEIDRILRRPAIIDTGRKTSAVFRRMWTLPKKTDTRNMKWSGTLIPMARNICLISLSESSDINFTKRPKLYRIKALN